MRNDGQARSCMGSPLRREPSQSSTAARPSLLMMRLPLRMSECTTVWRGGGPGRWRSSHRSPSANAGRLGTSSETVTSISASAVAAGLPTVVAGQLGGASAGSMACR